MFESLYKSETEALARSEPLCKYNALIMPCSDK
jgi:hypothetical protein